MCKAVHLKNLTSRFWKRLRMKLVNEAVAITVVSVNFKLSFCLRKILAC